jgi:thiol-disulfide isomerase/thioredoxin
MFVIAAVAKLADRDGARDALSAFGVPKALGSAIVAIEFGIAAMLLVAPRAGAVAAMSVLTGFSAVALVSLARGRRVECHCFGRLSSGPLGWAALARNACFTAMAAFVALDGQFAWPLMTFAGTMLIAWLGPRWRARAADSGLDLDKLRKAGRPVVLVFSQPGCGACEALQPEVEQWQHDERVTVALIDSPAAFAAYGITATPSAVLIDDSGTRATARGADAIRDLVARATHAFDESRFSRRGLLRRASVGLVLPAVTAAACDSDKHVDTNSLEVDGAWLCNQTFALCTTAPCVPSPSDPNISVCDCVVVNGFSVGYKPCPERAQSGNKVRSAFSTVNVNASFGVLSCPSGVPWANCLDVECEIDPANPAVAKCQCITVKTGESRTFGGGCNTATCTSTIWSAATADLPGTAQYRKGMKQLGQQMVDFPRACPAPHP